MCQRGCVSGPNKHKKREIEAEKPGTYWSTNIIIRTGSENTGRDLNREIRDDNKIEDVIRDENAPADRWVPFFFRCILYDLL